MKTLVTAARRLVGGISCLLLFHGAAVNAEPVTAHTRNASDLPTTLQQQADAGSVTARAMLGDYYAATGTDHSDPALALWWYLQAAALGDVHAQYEAGKMFALASGTPPNWITAAKWMALAADAGNEEAHADLERLRLNMTLKARLAAHALAKRWRMRQANAAWRPGGLAGAAQPTPAAVSVDGLGLAGIAPFLARSSDAYSVREDVALLGRDYRAEFSRVSALPTAMVNYSVESTAEWDYFGNFKLGRQGPHQTAASPLGEIEYREITLEDQSSCIHFQRVWANDLNDAPFGAPLGAHPHDDEFLSGYLCSRARRPLAPDEINEFFASLRVVAQVVP